MSLQSKFAVLIGLLSLTAAVSLGGAIWSVGLLEAEVSKPFTATTQLLRDASEAIGRTKELRGEITNTHAQAVQDDDALRRGLDRLIQASAQLDDLDYGSVRIGGRYAELLRQSTDRSRQAVLNLENDTSEDTRDLALAELDAHESLLQRLESQAVDSAELTVNYVSDVRRGILLFQIIAVATAILSAALALILHRRWIVKPVGRLRVGAERLATGDLDYRVPETGSDELALLGREVNIMAATVKRMQHEAVERERFAAVGKVVRRVAHNIRNPLAGIRGLAETALDDLPDGSDVRDGQSRIINTVDRFDGWLSDFLHATSPNEVTPTEHNAVEWIESSLEALRPMAEAQQVDLILDPSGAPDRALIDPPQLEQALVAVVTNAVETTSPGGTVKVCATTHEEWWELTISDDGPGIDPDHLHRLFDADFTTKVGGHGIGLTAARWIVRQHGGMMSAHNATPGSTLTGAVFTIRLPLGGNTVHDDGEVDRAQHSDS